MVLEMLHPELVPHCLGWSRTGPANLERRYPDVAWQSDSVAGLHGSVVIQAADAFMFDLALANSTPAISRE